MTPSTSKNRDPRFNVVDGNGQPLRSEGFSRFKKISRFHGEWLLKYGRCLEYAVLHGYKLEHSVYYYTKLSKEQKDIIPVIRDKRIK